MSDHQSKESGFRENGKSNVLLNFSASGLGQRNPTHCPSPEGQNPTCSDPFGEPLGIREVARLIGCSVWAVRNRLLRRGLPHIRLSSGGRLIFYKKQVAEWLLEIQKEGRCQP